MKKVFTLVAVATLSLVACGPSAEEIAAKEKATADSIAAAEAAIAAEEAAKAQAIADSTANYAAAAEAEAKRIEDSIANAKPAKGTSKPKPKTAEPVKPGTGRG